MGCIKYIEVNFLKRSTHVYNCQNLLFILSIVYEYYNTPCMQRLLFKFKNIKEKCDGQKNDLNVDHNTSILILEKSSFILTLKRNSHVISIQIQNVIINSNLEHLSHLSSRATPGDTTSMNIKYEYRNGYTTVCNFIYEQNPRTLNSLEMTSHTI